jgi:hypothetical protein
VSLRIARQKVNLGAWSNKALDLLLEIIDVGDWAIAVNSARIRAPRRRLTPFSVTLDPTVDRILLLRGAVDLPIVTWVGRQSEAPKPIGRVRQKFVAALCAATLIGRSKNAHIHTCSGAIWGIAAKSICATTKYRRLPTEVSDALVEDRSSRYSADYSEIDV